MDETLIEYFEDSTTSAKKQLLTKVISAVIFYRPVLAFTEKKFELSIVTRFNYAGYSDVNTNYDSIDQHTIQPCRI